MSESRARRMWRDRRAIVLISLSWCVLILSLLLFSRIRSVDLSFENEKIAKSQLQLRLAARSVVNMILAAMAAETSDGENEFDAYSDSWGWESLRGRLEEVLAEEYHDIEISVAIEDEDSKVSLDGEDTKPVADLFESLGWPQLRAKDLAVVLKDLASQELQGASGTDEAESENPSLAQLPEGLRFITRVSEITPTILYGEDIDFDRKMDDCENDGEESYPPDDRNGALELGLERFLTLRKGGAINPNLAPYEVLLTVPGVSRRIAEEIVSKRCGPDGVAGTQDDYVFKTTEDLMSLRTISQYREMEFSKMVKVMRTTSSCFTIRVCTSTPDGHQRWRIQTCVKRNDGGKINTLSWLEDNGF